MTSLRPTGRVAERDTGATAPGRRHRFVPGGAPIVALGDAERAELLRLVESDPYVNAVLASRLAVVPTLEPLRFGGTVHGIYDPNGLVAAAFDGGNLLPVGGAPEHWRAFAGHLAGRPRRCTSIVGRADAVATMWPLLQRRWGQAREVRAQQPLLVLDRAGLSAPADRRVRVMTPDDLERYLPAAAAMFSEELGISPFAGAAGASYRRRVGGLLAAGRAFGVVDAAGRMAFKADIGALSAQTCQLHGVWVRPDLRGRGLGTAALGGVLHHALRLAPTVSLYVNDFNAPARRMYANLGMKQVATLATVLF